MLSLKMKTDSKNINECGDESRRSDRLADMECRSPSQKRFKRSKRSSYFFTLFSISMVLLFSDQMFFQVPTTTAWSIWTCKSYEPWPTTSENIYTTIQFQNWLYAWHHSCDRGIISQPVLHYNGGYGHSFQKVAEKLVSSIELNRVYVSKEIFLWADEESSHCTLQTKTIDCYFEPISTCGHGNLSVVEAYKRSDINVASTLTNFIHDAVDTCTMAKTIHKSLIWVYGQFLKYLIRPRKDIMVEIRKLTNSFLSLRSPTSSVLAVHIRGGHPDAGRIPLNLSAYIPSVDLMVEHFASLGKPVVAVYFCSDLIEENARSSEYVQAMYPRPWKAVVLPHVSLGSGEAELNLKLLHQAGNRNMPSKHQLMVDFLMDLEILTNADGFLGSGSNIYFLASAMRAANQAGPRNQTCMMQAAPEGPTMLCENSDEMKHIWHQVSAGGYDGGSPFAEY